MSRSLLQHAISFADQVRSDKKATAHTRMQALIFLSRARAVQRSVNKSRQADDVDRLVDSLLEVLDTHD